jgi:hypothetical protein
MIILNFSNSSRHFLALLKKNSTLGFILLFVIVRHFNLAGFKTQWIRQDTPGLPSGKSSATRPG